VVAVIENHPETAVLYASYKPLLFSLAYRMLGSVMDAEDIVHEAFLSLNKAGSDHVHNIRSYLCKIVTNRCIDLLQSSRKQREVYVGTWLPEPLVSEAREDADPSRSYLLKESISTAYLLLLQQLSYVERAVFLLREALQYDYDEIADIVGKSSTNCRQIYHRAKRSLSTFHESADAIPSEQDHNVRLPAYEPTAGVVEQFMHALANADVGQLLNVLSPDATLFTDGGGKVTAPPRPIRGSERISVFLAGLPAKVPSVLSFHTTVVNGQPGIVAHTNGQTIVVFSFKMDNGSIAELYAVVNPEKLKHVK
jgi:RNA polymerase sigma-70 factor (TIGR02957 family)